MGFLKGFLGAGIEDAGDTAVAAVAAAMAEERFFGVMGGPWPQGSLEQTTCISTYVVISYLSI